MAAPDFARQAVASSSRRRESVGRTKATRPGIADRPTATGLVWAFLDLMTAFVAGIMALRVRLTVPATPHPMFMLPQMIRTEPQIWLLYLLFFGVCVVLLTQAYGLYGPIQYRSGLNEQRMTIQATLTAGLLLCGALYLSQGEAFSRIVVLLLVAITAVLLSIRRAIWRRMVYRRFREGLETRNVLIVGAGRVAHALRNHLESLRYLGFRFKGFVALNEVEAESGDADVIGDMRNCLALARSMFVDEIFISVPADRKLVVALVDEARGFGIDVRVVPDLYDGLAWNASIEYIGQFPTIPLHAREIPIAGFLLKRTIDILVSSLALLGASPLLLVLALAVRLDSKGPIFYRAARIGRKGRTFACFKFRTMVVNADRLKADLEHMNEREGVLFKIVNDPRITRVGRMLRKYSLDELPQLYNVLRGDMSLVGPRPPIASEVEKYDLAHLRRLDVLPGITGLWQVEARQDPSFDSYISLDTAYVENWSIFLDLKILARTVGVVFGGTGS